jgi:hypothetical protein
MSCSLTYPFLFAQGFTPARNSQSRLPPLRDADFQSSVAGWCTFEKRGGKAFVARSEFR